MTSMVRRFLLDDKLQTEFKNFLLYKDRTFYFVGIIITMLKYSILILCFLLNYLLAEVRFSIEFQLVY